MPLAVAVVVVRVEVHVEGGGVEEVGAIRAVVTWMVAQRGVRWGVRRRVEVRVRRRRRRKAAGLVCAQKWRKTEVKVR